MSIMVKEDIETVIDRLADYVKAGGEVTLNDAASALGMQPNQVERLALLLEEKGLLEVRYTLGGVKLGSHKPEGEAADSKKILSAGKTERNTVGGDELEREVLMSENLLQFFETDLQRRNNRAQRLLEDLEKRDDYTEEELRHLKNEVNLSIKQLDSFSEEIRKLGAMESGFKEKLSNFNTRLSTMEAKPQGVIETTRERAPKSPVEKMLAVIERLLRGLKKLYVSAQDAVLRAIQRQKRESPPQAPRPMQVDETAKQQLLSPTVLQMTTKGQERIISTGMLPAPIEQLGLEGLTRLRPEKPAPQPEEKLEENPAPAQDSFRGELSNTEKQLLEAIAKIKEIQMRQAAKQLEMERRLETSVNAQAAGGAPNGAAGAAPGIKHRKRKHHKHRVPKIKILEEGTAFHKTIG